VHVGEVILIYLIDTVLPGMGCVVVSRETGMRISGQDVKLLKRRRGIGSDSEEVLGQERLADGHGGIEGEREVVPLVGNPTSPEQGADAIDDLEAKSLESDTSPGVSVSQAESTSSFDACS
jgi:hypothetical protein